MAIATEHGFSFWLAGGMIMRGWALAEQGSGPSGIAQLRQGLTTWWPPGRRRTGPTSSPCWPKPWAGKDRSRKAWACWPKPWPVMDGTGEGFHGAELHRLQGEFLLRQEATEAACREAEDCFRRALAIARRQQAKSLELRAAMSLTRLYQKQDRQAEARPMLAECYDWFTEGFDTPDLQEAKALLEQVC